MWTKKYIRKCNLVVSISRQGGVEVAAGLVVYDYGVFPVAAGAVDCVEHAARERNSRAFIKVVTFILVIRILVVLVALHATARKLYVQAQAQSLRQKWFSDDYEKLLNRLFQFIICLIPYFTSI